jgi:hypothetical protein
MDAIAVDGGVKDDDDDDENEESFGLVFWVEEFGTALANQSWRIIG